jgi:hypothetical protein
VSFAAEGTHLLEIISDSDGLIDAYALGVEGIAPHAVIATGYVEPLAGQEDRAVSVLVVDHAGVVTDPPVVTALDDRSVPIRFEVLGNYPNPFNPSTTVRFDLPERAAVGLRVYDVLGREVLRVPDQLMEAGSGRSLMLAAGSLPSGAYVYRLAATSQTATWQSVGVLTLVR